MLLWPCIVLAYVTACLAGRAIKLPVRKIVRPDATKATVQTGRTRLSMAPGPAHAKPMTLMFAQNNWQSYVISVSFGNAPFKYNLLLDSGSSLTLAGTDSRNPFAKPRTAIDSRFEFAVIYGDGSSVNGEIYLDNIAVSGTLVVNSTIGGGSPAPGFAVSATQIDGILGIGPQSLLDFTLKSSSYRTFMTDAVLSGVLPVDQLGINFAPGTTGSDVNGAVTFGGYDSASLTSPITWAPCSGPINSATYWSVIATIPSIGLNATDSGEAATNAILDTGTTLIYIPDSAFENFSKAIPGAISDPNTGLLRFPKTSISSVPTLDITIGGAVFPMTAAETVVPIALYPSQKLDTNFAYSLVASGGSSEGSFLLGMYFFERYYVILDASGPSRRAGIARTKHSPITK
ncbi:hypothetical protein E5Q_01583 [Mixia osmundae IAM 14324]|uniref:Peptidase A1 domain-containing protein n=1 Tax=Mixia osmundae (strain CBS 9802 / IAM 14324 / JCM 22182 / KY 12970) TaxID=764103 RepID=G7DWG8_MIXOS|nr:hypothetical protein E5Q_01583 [Mixia osmundae IAM 14324]